MDILSHTDKLNLQKMINANDTVDQTEYIRTIQHSDKIKEQATHLLQLKSKYSSLAKTNPTTFDDICMSQCSLLFNSYTDIFNKIKKDEIDINILYKFLGVLKQIENSEVDQHQGSFLVGKYLKEMYIDSALKRSEKLDNKYNNKNPDDKFVKAKKISWKEYKFTYLNSN